MLHTLDNNRSNTSNTSSSQNITHPNSWSLFNNEILDYFVHDPEFFDLHNTAHAVHIWYVTQSEQSTLPTTSTQKYPYTIITEKNTPNTESFSDFTLTFAYISSSNISEECVINLLNQNIYVVLHGSHNYSQSVYNHKHAHTHLVDIFDENRNPSHGDTRLNKAIFMQIISNVQIHSQYDYKNLPKEPSATTKMRVLISSMATHTLVGPLLEKISKKPLKTPHSATSVYLLYHESTFSLISKIPTLCYVHIYFSKFNSQHALSILPEPYYRNANFSFLLNDHLAKHIKYLHSNYVITTNAHTRNTRCLAKKTWDSPIRIADISQEGIDDFPPGQSVSIDNITSRTFLAAFYQKKSILCYYINFSDVNHANDHLDLIPDGAQIGITNYSSPENIAYIAKHRSISFYRLQQTENSAQLSCLYDPNSVIKNEKFSFIFDHLTNNSDITNVVKGAGDSIFRIVIEDFCTRILPSFPQLKPYRYTFVITDKTALPTSMHIAELIPNPPFSFAFENPVSNGGFIWALSNYLRGGKLTHNLLPGRDVPVVIEVNSRMTHTTLVDLFNHFSLFYIRDSDNLLLSSFLRLHSGSEKNIGILIGADTATNVLEKTKGERFYYVVHSITHEQACLLERIHAKVRILNPHTSTPSALIFLQQYKNIRYEIYMSDASTENKELVGKIPHSDGVQIYFHANTCMDLLNTLPMGTYTVRLPHNRNQNASDLNKILDFIDSHPSVHIELFNNDEDVRILPEDLRSNIMQDLLSHPRIRTVLLEAQSYFQKKNADPPHKKRRTSTANPTETSIHTQHNLKRDFMLLYLLTRYVETTQLTIKLDSNLITRLLDHMTETEKTFLCDSVITDIKPEEGNVTTNSSSNASTAAPKPANTSFHQTVHPLFNAVVNFSHHSNVIRQNTNPTAPQQHVQTNQLSHIKEEPHSENKKRKK